ncbi:MAG: dethiobiotin synthase [Puniceicoccales bacterium]|jgi:dethiobiotin synthetase|nr:dethiobiotin synthase [Puniceicoccales bacterium]
MNIFVTGTDIGVGKTIVSAWICCQTEASYWKPIQTGYEHDSDRQTVEQLSLNTVTIDGAYRPRAPLSPYDAVNSEIFTRFSPTARRKKIWITPMGNSSGIFKF